MTNKEICTKAVAAYHMANPDITVDEWECDPDNEGVAILTVNGRKLRIKYDPIKGFEMLKNHPIPDKATSQTVAHSTPVASIPDPKDWNETAEAGTGALPVLLDILAIICAIAGIVLFNSVTMLWLAYVVGCFVGAVVLHIAATVIRSIRATQAHAANIERLLAHIAANMDA